MIKLTLSVIGASVLVTFNVPGPGSYYLFSSDGATSTVEASNYVTKASHVAATLPRCEGPACKLYYVWFDPRP